MPVIKVANSTEKYRQIANFSTDIHQLSGRRDRASTDRRIEIVTRLLGHNINGNLIFDVGCGDASFAKAFALSAKKVVGIVPTEEECERVLPATESTGVEIVLGKTDNIAEGTRRFGYPDLIFCNAVLLGVGFDANTVEASIAHFSNNQKRDGLLYVGEIPQTDELAGRNYGLSFTKYILYCISKGRYGTATANLWQFLRALVTNHVYIIQEQNMFHASPAVIEKLGFKYGYQLLAVYRSDSGQLVSSQPDSSSRPGRLDYFFKKIRV